MTDRDQENKYRLFMRQWAHRQGYRIAYNPWSAWKLRAAAIFFALAFALLTAYCFKVI